MNDREIILAALNDYAWVFECASEKLRKDREFVLIVVTKMGGPLKCASDELKKDQKSAGLH